MLKLEGKQHDLGGGMFVSRILPDRKKRMVGPFCFLDHMGPLTTAPEQNIDVRPHPHIGLSTLTYLYSGQMMHRDSLGSVAAIEPGDVNWMTAGRGISHSERAVESDRGRARNLHGLQFWVALPDDKEDIAPSFQHYNKGQIPFHENDERKIAVVAGEGFGLKSPVALTSPLIFADVSAKKNFKFDFANPSFEHAIYLIDGSARIGGEQISKNQLIAIEGGIELKLEVSAGSHFILIGGEAFSTPRNMWWNLVSSSKEKIELAKKQWRSGEFPMVPGETEFIPLPES